MGVGIAKRSLIFRIGAGVVKGALALVLFIIVLLVILRLMAAVRENGVEAPPETVRFQTPTGAVAARLSGPADGRPIMLIHGTAAWSGFWRQVADHLAGRGWRVIAIDLPPFGWSGRIRKAATIGQRRRSGSRPFCARKRRKRLSSATASG